MPNRYLYAHQCLSKLLEQEEAPRFFPGLMASSVSDQKVGKDTALSFEMNTMIKGNVVSHEPGSPTFILKETGIYVVLFEGCAKKMDLKTSPQVITYLAENGKKVGATYQVQEIKKKEPLAWLSFITVVTVTTPLATLIVKNEASTLTDWYTVYMDIVKIA